MKYKNKVMVVLVVVVIAMLALASPAAAQHVITTQSVCEDLGGIWSGPSTITGTCTYYPGSEGHSHSGIQAEAGGCGSDGKIVQVVDTSLITSTTCVPLSPGYFSPKGGRCKLTAIDNPIQVGPFGSFSASWVGTLSTIRFFSNEEGNHGASAATLVGAISKDGKVSTATFVGPYATPGQYFALCFGPGGSGGGSIGGIQITE